MDYDKIQTYINLLQMHLNLQAWDIFVATEPADEDCNASIQFTSGRRAAAIRIHPDWEEERSKEDKRNDLVHEMLHVFHHDADDNLFQFFRANGDMSDCVKNIVTDQTVRDLERMVDSLTNVIAPMMPPWPGVPELQE